MAKRKPRRFEVGDKVLVQGEVSLITRDRTKIIVWFPESKGCNSAAIQRVPDDLIRDVPATAPPEPLCQKCGLPESQGHEFGFRDHAFKPATAPTGEKFRKASS